MLSLTLALLIQGPAAADERDSLYNRDNLVAWCIVPFDGKPRTPEERAQMLRRLGIQRFAYDWRAEHLATFEQELDALERHGIELTALWFPATLDETARMFLATLSRRGIHTQLWVMGGGEPVDTAEEQASRVRAEADRIRPIAEAADAIGCTVALYNHGGWFGEPENQLAIIAELEREGIDNVGIVYNLHHGHDHLDRFPELLAAMKPYLLALNLNGMTCGGDRVGRKILVLGEGEEDLRLLEVIRDSGWRGPIGILNHTDEDAEKRLRANLTGLEGLVDRLGTK